MWSSVDAPDQDSQGDHWLPSANYPLIMASCWNATILLLKDDNTTCSLWLCQLLYMLSLIYESIFICRSMYLYIIMICTGGITIGMCLCTPLAASGLVYYWMNAYYIVMCVYCVFMWILYRYGYIYVLTHIILYNYSHHVVIQMTLRNVFLEDICNGHLGIAKCQQQLETPSTSLGLMLT